MTTRSPSSPAGGGIFLALCPIIGVLVGRHFGQHSIGLVAGVAVGAAIATLMWWRSR